jgi:Family of unknown function (DUF6174)
MTQETGDHVQPTAGSEEQRDEATRQRRNETLWLRLAGLAAILLLLVRLVACQPSSVGEAEKRWQASGVVDYRIQVREIQSTWCYYEINLEVQNNQVVTGTIIAYPGPAQSCWSYTDGVVQKPIALSPDAAARWTVPGLFELARDWEGLAGKKDMKIGLEFDPELGYPTSLHRDNIIAYDDDAGLSVLQFEPLRP